MKSFTDEIFSEAFAEDFFDEIVDQDDNNNLVIPIFSGEVSVSVFFCQH